MNRIGTDIITAIMNLEMHASTGKPEKGKEGNRYPVYPYRTGIKEKSGSICKCVSDDAFTAPVPGSGILYQNGVPAAGIGHSAGGDDTETGEKAVGDTGHQQKPDAGSIEIRCIRKGDQADARHGRIRVSHDTDGAAVFKQYFDERSIREILQYASPARMYRYYTNVLEEKRDYGDYLDYLEAAAFCGWDMRNDMVLFPKHFRQAHDMAVEDQRVRKTR